MVPNVGKGQRSLVCSRERAVARFFFDIHDGSVTHDDDGTELPDVEAVRRHARSILPPIAAEEIPTGNDRRHFAILVTDEDGCPVYSATLTYTGLWLLR